MKDLDLSHIDRKDQWGLLREMIEQISDAEECLIEYRRNRSFDKPDTLLNRNIRWKRGELERLNTDAKRLFDVLRESQSAHLPV